MSIPVTSAGQNHKPLGTSSLASTFTPRSRQAPDSTQTPAPPRLNNLQKLAIALAHQKQAKHAHLAPPPTPTVLGAQSLGNLALNVGASKLDLLSASSLNEHPSAAPVQGTALVASETGRAKSESTDTARNSGSPALPSAPRLPRTAFTSVLPSCALACMSESIVALPAIKREILEDTSTVRKRKRSASASGDRREIEGKGKTARIVERVVIDLTLVSDDEDDDEATNKSRNCEVVFMDVDAEGGAKEKEKENDSDPPPSSLAPPATQERKHRNQVEDSHPDSNRDPDKPAGRDMEVDFKSTLESVVPPPQEHALALASIFLSTSAPSVIKPELHDVPLPTSLPLSRPLLSRKHLRLVFKKQEDNILCVACWYD